MVKVTRAQRLANSITEAQVRFFNMNENERIDYINRYDKMQPYQKVALRCCKKFMSPREKLAYKKVTSPKTEVLAEEPEQSK